MSLLFAIIPLMALPSPFQISFDYEQFNQAFATAIDDKSLFKTIVNAPFEDHLSTTLISLAMIVLLLVNKQTGTIDPIALTTNEFAEGTENMSAKRFKDIKIPLKHSRNITSRAIELQTPQSTTDWKYLFIPILDGQESRLKQAGGAIAFSAVYPLLHARSGGALIYSYHQHPEDMKDAQQEFMTTYSSLVVKALQIKHQLMVWKLNAKG